MQVVKNLQAAVAAFLGASLKKISSFHFLNIVFKCYFLLFWFCFFAVDSYSPKCSHTGFGRFFLVKAANNVRSRTLLIILLFINQQ